jgi:adenosylcobyric acid synthase
MHIGRTTGPDLARPLLRFEDGKDEGATSADGRVTGCYVHGLFADDRQRAGWLERLNAMPSGLQYEAAVDETLDLLAAHIERHIDCDALLDLAEEPIIKAIA